MAFPATRALVEHLRDDGRQFAPEIGVEDSPDDPETRRYLALQLKRRHHNRMLKAMLKDAGYEDLSKMVRIRKQNYEVPEE